VTRRRFAALGSLSFELPRLDNHVIQDLEKGDEVGSSNTLPGSGFLRLVYAGDLKSCTVQAWKLLAMKSGAETISMIPALSRNVRAIPSASPETARRRVIATGQAVFVQHHFTVTGSKRGVPT
jgi:hypothetical protein